MNKQPVTCARCHQIIVAEEGDTCASIPAWQRGRFDYCDTAATVEQTWIDQAIGPRVVGGTYYNGYWGDTYTVQSIWRTRDASGWQWEMRVRWSDGHTSVHCTGWDAKRDRVVGTATVPTYCVRCKQTWQRPNGQHTDYCELCRNNMVANTRRCNTYDATATVPEHAPAGMLAVRVGSDPWTMIPLDNEPNPVGWDVIDTSTD